MRNSSRSEIDPFIVMDVMEAARAAEAAGRDIIHMEVGQPSTGAPAAARAALAEAMEAGPLGYTVALGLPVLRARIAALYKEWYGVEVSAERVIVTAGASGAFLLAFSGLFDAGERVGLGLPGYPSYRHILTALSLEPVGLSARAENRLQPVPEDVPEGLSGLILASPGNPSGTMLSREALSALAARAADIGAALVSDEIYHGLDFGQRAVSALEVTDDVIVVNSFSKYFSMTGWRVGWMVVPQDQVRRYERLAQNMFICPPHASQIAALAAMDAGEELEANRAVYAANRQLMLEGLPEAGLGKFAPPDGAFYIYADVSEYTDDARALAADILEKVGVAVTPGLDFDPERGHHWLRLSYAGTTADMAEGIARLKRYFKG
ncbi:aminotransferase class I/II-fold pyridoxal phosphate-dependent enzyme [Alphaproteobacteria bacterium KMM 3653]|uniref:Aminotransferase n=1 Tax=Harenicola maris TaxID=2841044 RepID=A0AAP2G2V1_9RHOB|nr:aminotransferase class I/II-fold pyridoxal phosphate-dependent enzyme [Harenicola maris]